MKTFGFSYNSDIIRSITNVFLSVIEDVDSHLGAHLKEIPNNQVLSPETIARGLKELTSN